MRSIQPICPGMLRILLHGRGYLPTANQMATQMTPRKAAVPPKTAHCTESGVWWRSIMRAGKDMDLTSGARVGASGRGTGSRKGGGAASGKDGGAAGGGSATWGEAASATMMAAAHRAS